MKTTNPVGAAPTALAASCRFVISFLIASTISLVGHPTIAAIMSGTGTGTITLDASAGGGPTETISGPIPMFGGMLTYTPGPAFSGGPILALMNESWSFTLPEVAPFDVFVAHDASKGMHPSGDPFLFEALGSAFTTTLKADFSVTFTLDAGGLGETLIPKIEYPIFWVGSSGTETFDASISYSDDFGALGTRVLHFAPPPGSTGLMDETGFGALDLLPLPPGDHLTLAGSFLMTVNAHGGTAAEIKVEGVPEPSTVLLVMSGVVALFVGRSWRRRKNCSRA